MFHKYCIYKKSAIFSQKVNQLLNIESFSKFYFLFYFINISFTKLAKNNLNLLLISTEKLESSKFDFIECKIELNFSIFFMRNNY
jgi:hypothetical protein